VLPSLLSEIVADPGLNPNSVMRFSIASSREDIARCAVLCILSLQTGTVAEIFRTQTTLPLAHTSGDP
jgi:hypothetical protein